MGMPKPRVGHPVRTAILMCAATLCSLVSAIGAAGPAGASMRSGAGKVVSGGAAYSRCDKTVTTDVARLVTEINDQSVFENDIVALDLKFGTGNREMQLITDGVTDYLQDGAAATKNFLAEGCALLAHVVIGSNSTTTTSPSATGVPHVELLKTSGGVSGVETAVSSYLNTLGGSLDATPGTLACAGPPKLKHYTDLLCHWVQGNGIGSWAYAFSTKLNATRILLVDAPQIQCSKLAPGQVAAVEAWTLTKTCVSPEGIYVPSSVKFSPDLPGDSSALSDDSIGTLVSGDNVLPSAVGACAGGDVVAVQVDPHDPSWLAWYYYADGAEMGNCPSVGGLAHEASGTWRVVSGPVFDLACGAPASVPAKVLHELGASKTCPPTPARFGASFSTTATTTTQPAATAAGVPIPALVTVLVAYFASGCAGGCATIQEPASNFTTQLDPQDPTWAKWVVNDPTLGGAAGFAQEVDSTWTPVGGLGSGALVGCGSVPNSVLSYFAGSPVTC
jgi:hypothetical protein